MSESDHIYSGSDGIRQIEMKKFTIMNNLSYSLRF
jgi:hypothetical protein